MDAAHAPASSTHQPGDGSLISAGFLGLLATQFLTAANDNIFKNAFVVFVTFEAD